MSRINRLALGLQDFLGSQSLGDNPSELAQFVQPTLEMGPFLGAERFIGQTSNTVVVAADGQITAQLVIPNRLFLVYGVGIEVLLSAPTANNSCKFSATISGVDTDPSNPIVEHPLADLGEVTSKAGAQMRRYLNTWLPTPVPARANSTIFFRATDFNITTGTMTCRTTLWHYALRV